MIKISSHASWQGWIFFVPLVGWYARSFETPGTWIDERGWVELKFHAFITIVSYVRSSKSFIAMWSFKLRSSSFVVRISRLFILARSIMLAPPPMSNPPLPCLNPSSKTLKLPPPRVTDTTCRHNWSSMK